MTIEELMASMQAIIDGADAEKRSLTDEEVSQYEDLEKKLKAVQATSNLKARQAVYARPSNTVEPPVTGNREINDELERAFESYLRTGQRNADLTELYAQGEGTPSAGGYMVPDGFRQKMVERMARFGGLMEVAENFTTASGNPITWPTIDDTANSGEIVAEHGTGTSGADIVFGVGSLGAYKYMSLGAGNLPLRVSVELLQDAEFDVTGLVTRVMGKRIARAMSTDFATGDGSGEPLGILTGSADVELATSNPVTYAKLLDVVHSVDPDYRQNARWVFNDASLKSIRLLEDENSRPLWLPSTGSLADSLPGGTLLGFPVTIDQAFPDAADDTNFAVFGDIEEAYVVRHVRDIVLVVDPYGRAANGEVQFTAWARADGTIQNRNAYAILAGFNA